MAAIFKLNDWTDYPTLSLEEKGFIVSESNIPILMGKIARYFKSFVVPRARMLNNVKISWNDNRFRDSGRDQIVIIVENISNINTHKITINAFTSTEESRLNSLRSNPTCFILDKLVLDNCVPHTGPGVLAILGQTFEDAHPFYQILLLRQDYSIPNGTGGAPYAGGKIPND